MRISLTDEDALIVVDVQNDFCPGGALPAPDGDKVVPPLNGYITRFHRAGLPVAASRDWHPEDHMSFEDEGGPWPPHCVQGTEGAQYHPDLELPPETEHIEKGTDPDEEDYSAFLGSPNLRDWLHGQEVQRVFVGGLTTEYCVKNTVEDALDAGFTTFLLLDGIKGVEAEEGDAEQAIAEMLQAGAVGIEADELIL